MRTLFLSEQVPFPLDGARKQRIFHLLKGVASASDVTLVCFLRSEAERESLEPLRPLCRAIHCVPSHQWGHRDIYRKSRAAIWAHSLAEYLHPTEPALLRWYESSHARRLVAELCSRPFDVIWAERLVCMRLLPKGVQTRVIVDIDDLEHRKLAHRLRHSGWDPLKPFHALEYLKLKRIEDNFLRTRFEFAVCSALDRAHLENNPRVWVVPNGVDLPEGPSGAAANAEFPVFAFIGTMSYDPNVDAACYFARRILPLIRREIPEARFLIVGRDPAPAVQRLNDRYQVEVTGGVSDVAPYLQRAIAAVAPIRFGGGTRIKILEAMAHRKAVVSTSIGAEGLEVTSGEHLLIADTSENFAASCIALWQDRQLRDRLADSAQALIARQYTWDIAEDTVGRILRTGQSLSTAVIIATRNRVAALAGTLTSLAQQSHQPDQLIIVDQSAGVETRDLALGYRGGTPVTYVHATNLAGAGAARNIGISRASCDVLVFLDDDVQLEPDFLEKLLVPYQRDSAIGGVSGIVTNYRRPPLHQRLLSEFFCVGPFRDPRMPLYWNASALRDAEPIPIRKFTGCLMSLRRNAMEPDRFDDRYPGAGAEDVDLSWRVSARSQLVLAPGARAAHLQSPVGSRRDNWISHTATQYWYLYRRLWRGSLFNRLCFLWVQIGFALCATVGSIRRRSLAPWRSLRSGIATANALARDCGNLNSTSPARLPENV